MIGSGLSIFFFFFQMTTDPLGIILSIKGCITSFYSLKGGKAKISLQRKEVKQFLENGSLDITIQHISVLACKMMDFLSSVSRS